MRNAQLNFIEAVYRPDAYPSLWLEGVANAFCALSDLGRGVLAWSASCHGSVAEAHFASAEMEAGLEAELKQAFVSLDRAALENLQCTPVTLGSSSSHLAAAVRRMSSRSVTDVLCVTASSDQEYVGLVLPFLTMSQTELHLDQQWQRSAAHLAAGLRLRSLGGLPHAAALPAATARESLRREAVSHARSCAFEDQSHAAWTDLVGGTWIVTDTFDSQGQRYLVARRGHVGLGLTQRQRRVLAARATGQSLKVIASEVQVSISTVAQDLARAVDVLGLGN